MFKKNAVLLGLSCIVSMLIFTGCGKNEATGGTVGAAAGAVIGNAVSGGHNKTGGTLIGALIGNALGRSIGQAEDQEEQREEHNREIRTLQNQNQRLQKELTRWCENCSREVRLKGAQSCPDCGGDLIHEKFCSRCKTTFSPESGYKFCPYCKVKVRLEGR